MLFIIISDIKYSNNNPIIGCDLPFLSVPKFPPTTLPAPLQAQKITFIIWYNTKGSGIIEI